MTSPPLESCFSSSEESVEANSTQLVSTTKRPRSRNQVPLLQKLNLEMFFETYVNYVLFFVLRVFARFGSSVVTESHERLFCSNNPRVSKVSTLNESRRENCIPKNFVLKIHR